MSHSDLRLNHLQLFRVLLTYVLCFSGLLSGDSAHATSDLGARNYNLGRLGDPCQTPPLTGIIDPPLLVDGTFVVTQGLDNGFRVVSTPCGDLVGCSNAPLCRPEAFDIPTGSELKLWLYRNGQLEPGFPQVLPSNAASTKADITHTFVDGNYYTVLLAYEFDAGSGPELIPLNLSIPLKGSALPGAPPVSVDHQFNLSDWPTSWPGDGSYVGMAPPELTFYYETRPVTPSFHETSEWAEWPSNSGTMASNYAKTIRIQDIEYHHVTWRLTGPEDYDQSWTTVETQDGFFEWQLPDFSNDLIMQGHQSGYSLSATAVNRYGVAGTITADIASLRQLRFDAITWDLHYLQIPDPAGGFINRLQEGLKTTRHSRTNQLSCYDVVDGNNIDLRFELKEWGPHATATMPPQPDYEFNLGLIAERDDRNNDLMKIRSSAASSSMSVQFSDFDLEQNWYLQGNGTAEYEEGHYIEVALLEVLDQRSQQTEAGPNGNQPTLQDWMEGPSWQQHRLRLDFLIGHNGCAGASQLTFVDPVSEQPVPSYSVSQGAALDIAFIPEFDLVHAPVDYTRLYLVRDGTPERLFINLPWEECAIGQAGNPDLISGLKATFQLPEDISFGETNVLRLEVCNDRFPAQSGNNCEQVPVLMAAEIPIMLDQSNQAELDGFHIAWDSSSGMDYPWVDTLTGAVNFQFGTITHGIGPEDVLEWQWSRQMGSETEYWLNGNWAPQAATFVGIGLDQDPFAEGWHWDANADTITPLSRPFAVQSWVQNFFIGNQTQEVTFSVRLRRANGSLSEVISFTQAITPILPPDPTANLQELQVAWNQGPCPVPNGCSYDRQISYAAGSVDGLKLRIATNDLTPGEPNLVGTHLFTLEGVQTGGDIIPCRQVGINQTSLTGTFAISFVTDDGLNYYQLDLNQGSDLATHLDQAGSYRLRIFGVAGQCSGLSESLTVLIHVQPVVPVPESHLAVKLHFRDHLGTTLAEKAFRPSASSSPPQGTVTLQLGGRQVSLYGQAQTYAFYEPFGDLIPSGDVNSDDDPRYTDHERDLFSGFNYMKGRFQLPTLASFNRPDPQRDWDWINPHSLNLYQYVRNEPISNYDPSGLYIIKKPDRTGTEEEYQKALEEHAKRVEAFEAARLAALERGGDIAKAAGVYGELGTENGIVVTFGDPGENRGGVTHQTIDFRDSENLEHLSKMMVKPGLTGDDLEVVLAHEGQHILDGQKIFDSAKEDYERDEEVDITIGESEMNAFMISHYVLKAQRRTGRYETPKGDAFLGRRVKEKKVRANILKILTLPIYKDDVDKKLIDD